MNFLSYKVSSLHSSVQAWAKSITYGPADSVCQLLKPHSDNSVSTHQLINFLSDKFSQNIGVIKTWSYYSFFAATFSAIHEIGKVLFPEYYWSKKIVAGVVGGLLQGDPSCPAQQAIERYPLTGFVAGAINGVGCCYIHPIFSKQIEEFTGGNNLLGLFLTSAVVMPVVCRYVMCPIESTIKDMAMYFQGEKAEVRSCCRG